MAIKIKNRENQGDEPELPEDDSPQAPLAGASAGGLDRFERSTIMLASWLEENRGIVLGGVIAVVVLILAGLLGMQYVRGQQVEASDRLSAGLASYEVLVEGSPILEMWRQQEEIQAPTNTFGSTEEKWESIHSASASTLDDFARGPVAASARLTQAAAALNLGRAEEAVSLYREVIDSGEASDELVSFARIGLAESLAASGDVTAALQELDRFAEHRADKRAFVDFMAGQFLERSGDSDAARARYEAFLEAHGTSPFRGDVERRLALL